MKNGFKPCLSAGEMRVLKKGAPRRLFAFKVKEKTIFYRCATCGAKSQKTHRNVEPDSYGIKRLASWHSKEKGGCSGFCKTCGKKSIKERYPNGFRELRLK